MEEILASIRRIITDDETGETKPQDAAPQTQQDDDAPEGDGAADNQIIDDIARVLSAGEPEVGEEEEILDLTFELGGLEVVDDAGAVAAVEEVVELTEKIEAVEELELVEEVVELVEEIEFLDEVAAEPVAEAPAPASPSVEDLTQQEIAQQAALAEVQEPAPEQAEAPAPAPAPPPSASAEAASALERAIAALKAGGATTTTPLAAPFQFQAAPQPETAPEAELETHPEPVFTTPGEPVSASEAPASEALAPEEPASEPGSIFGAPADTAPTFELSSEPETVVESILTEIEVTVTEERITATEVESETTPFWPAATSEEARDAEPAPEPSVAPEPVAPHVNGAQAPGSTAKTLEDSVKDMLRPMLRQWLDDNMPRIVKDQLDNDVTPGRQD